MNSKISMLQQAFTRLAKWHIVEQQLTHCRTQLALELDLHRQGRGPSPVGLAMRTGVLQHLSQDLLMDTMRSLATVQHGAPSPLRVPQRPVAAAADVVPMIATLVPTEAGSASASTPAPMSHSAPTRVPEVHEHADAHA